MRLKCNRAQPCDSCVRRGLSSSCSYPAPTRRNKPERAFKPGNASKMQTRIETLERLVVSLMNNGETDSSIAVESPGQGSITRTDDEATSEGPPILEDEEWERVTRSLGRISVEKSQTSYVGAGHWAAILDGVRLFAHAPSIKPTILTDLIDRRSEGLFGGEGRFS